MGYDPMQVPPFAPKPRMLQHPRRIIQQRTRSSTKVDDIFKIDLSSSNRNDSSMYAIRNKRAKLELDFTLLWHCHLGHINKKRIEKLQHDGPLDSNNIKSFEKCVSCMSGKMTRKPYSHQVERAKDLLGLIHTDVCGPFKIMSRQGASYFVTFTDDFSRYGYVYLHKHKHEVFKTFKVFQKEVENQLKKTIKSLHFDRREDGKQRIKDDQEIDEPQSDIIPICKSFRIRRAPNRMCLHVDVEERELGDLVDLPPNGKTVGHKWLFKKKTDMDGAVHTYKACLVEKGFTQTPWIDYEETFSSVADIGAIKILIAIAALYDFEI
nr:retrotransposon protein, putative, Ty1-copia subclass [Tanacetum cinerariifolium]